MAKTKKSAGQRPPEVLQGWKAIGEYLGIGVATAQRWAKSGMPVKREGRYTVAQPEEISRWIAKEAQTAQVLMDDDAISAALQQSITAVRRDKGKR